MAIGEIGLDFHYDHSPRDAQREAFRRQIRLARDVGLPIVVHTREADEETADILEQEGAAEAGGVIHCFTGGLELARRALGLGFLISFSGIVAFPRAEVIQQVAREVPEDRLLVETDAPFLAPPPHRGKRNEPAFVVDVARKVAALRGTTRRGGREPRPPQLHAPLPPPGVAPRAFDNAPRIRHFSLRRLPRATRAPRPEKRSPMADSSFDIVSSVDLQEVKNAIAQAMKEIQTRFDLKGTGSSVDLQGEEILLTSSDEFKLKAVRDVLEGRLVKRNVPLKALSFETIDQALGGTVRQRVTLQKGIPTEKAREIVKLIKGTKLKVQAAIQGDQLRVSGKNKDDLQAVMQLLKGTDLGIDMQFTNRR